MALENEQFCNFTDCPNNKDNKNNSQCMICQELYHYTCANVSNKARFVCATCRDTVKNMRSLQSTIQALNELLTNNVKTTRTLQSELKEKHEQYVLLVNENAKLKEENSRLQPKRRNGQQQPRIETPDLENNCDHLVITDSMLKDVDENKLSSTAFHKIPGARISAVEKKLESFQGVSYKTVTLHVATNDLYDIKDDSSKIPDVINNFKKLVQQVKALGDQVCISSVCPRLDQVGELVEPFNVALKVLCEEMMVKYIDHTPSFTLADGRVNDGYLWRNGPHLTKQGTNCVIRNLQIPLKPNVTEATKDRFDTYASALRHTNENRTSPANMDVNIHRDGCRHCNERGHNVSSCHHSRPVMCNICKLRGHKAKHHRSRF